jgi:hypothetical protein
MADYSKKYVKKRQRQKDRERDSEKFINRKKREKRLTFISILLTGVSIAIVYLYINNYDNDGMTKYVKDIKDNLTDGTTEEVIKGESGDLSNDLVRYIFEMAGSDTESVENILGNPENSLLINEKEKQDLNSINEMIQKEFDKYLD